VYVIDPYSITPVRQHLATRGGRHGRQVVTDPEAAYGEVVERLRDSGVAASGQRLAVIVSKADLLQAAGLELPADSDLIADWLMESGAHNLVLSARREFAEARFFTVASQVTKEDGRPDDPGTPLRWLLRSHGVRLPAENGSDRHHVNQQLGETTGARS
jgi:Double-GTPase 2